MLAIELVRFTGLNNQVIEVNPKHVVSIRKPRSIEHFGPGVGCVLTTTDGKIIIVIENCDVVETKLQEAK